MVVVVVVVVGGGGGGGSAQWLEVWQLTFLPVLVTWFLNSLGKIFAVDCRESNTENLTEWEFNISMLDVSIVAGSFVVPALIFYVGLNTLVWTYHHESWSPPLEE